MVTTDGNGFVRFDSGAERVKDLFVVLDPPNAWPYYTW